MCHLIVRVSLGRLTLLPGWWVGHWYEAKKSCSLLSRKKSKKNLETYPSQANYRIALCLHNSIALVTFSACSQQQYSLNRRFCTHDSEPSDTGNSFIRSLVVVGEMVVRTSLYLIRIRPSSLYADIGSLQTEVWAANTLHDILSYACKHNCTLLALAGCVAVTDSLLKAFWKWKTCWSSWAFYWNYYSITRLSAKMGNLFVSSETSSRDLFAPLRRHFLKQTSLPPSGVLQLSSSLRPQRRVDFIESSDKTPVTLVDFGCLPTTGPMAAALDAAGTDGASTCAA